jgi:hypothetical protein
MNTRDGLCLSGDTLMMKAVITAETPVNYFTLAAVRAWNLTGCL